MVGLENFELAGIKSYTRFWGLLMFGSYSVINVIVLLNLLIAMMSNSYAMITEHSDVEWKFARTRLWMSCFEESATLPPPFNIFPTPKLLLKILGLRKKDKIRKMKLEEQKEKEHDVRYTAVMRALVWRYVSAMHRRMDDEPVTEDDVNELKGDVSALRYELLEVFEKNGMDVSFTDRKEKAVLGKRMKVWERRLMKDFHVAPVTVDEEDKPAEEDGLAKFRRIAKMAVANTSNAKWDQTLAGTGISSQIGRCRSRESFKNQQNLQRAMEQARKLVMRSPLPEGSRAVSPIEMPVTPGNTLLELIKDISTDVGEPIDLTKSPYKLGTGAVSPALLGAIDSQSRTVSPQPRTQSPGQKDPVKGLSPAPSGGPSPVLRSVSPIVEEPAATQSEPSPLKAKRVPGEVSPPKVIKRKPPGLPAQGDDQVTEATKDEVKPSEDIAVARPIAPEIKPAEGALPPPPPPVKPKAPVAPSMEVTPSTPPVHASKPPSPTPAASSTAPPVSSTPLSTSPTSGSKPATPTPRAASPLPTTSSLPRTPTPPTPQRLTSTSSTEQLIPPPSPEPLQPIKKLDDIKTIKRQQKTGWL